MAHTKKTRILIYSHDTFGLGHIRRCRAIANSLVSRFEECTVLILSGSPLISQFEFKVNVDFVRIPGVIKLKDGRYTSLGMHIDVQEILAIRESIIQHTAEAFKPDLFIVDKEPLGLHKEIEKTLHLLKKQGCKNILGIRDVLDEPEKLRKEWHHKKAVEAIEMLYHEVWVYGDAGFYQPLQALPLSDMAKQRIHYTGYIERQYHADGHEEELLIHGINSPYILVTAGGGKDGEEVIDLVLKAYSQSGQLPYHALIVLGPFMSKEQRSLYHKRAQNHDNITVIDFHSRLELLMYHAAGVVCMGGYNTFCELLSFDKPSVIIPRFTPRLEQTIRAQRAEDLSLCEVLDIRTMDTNNQPRYVEQLVDMLHRLPTQPKPSQQLPANFLSGIDNICERVSAILAAD